jgi:carbamoyltransferase
MAHILAIHCGHNSSAALMLGGAIVGSVQEERFTKRKNQVAFPVRSIRHLVDAHLGSDATSIEKVVFATRDVDPVGLAVSRYSDFSVADHVQEMHQYWKGVFYEGRPNDGSYWKDMFARGERLNQDHNVDVARLMAMPLDRAIRQLSDVERPEILESVFGWRKPTQVANHHECHAYYALYGAPIAPSDRADTLVLTADSWGDLENWSAWTVGDDGRLNRLDGGAQQGIARIYRFTTLILGMKPNEHEYKVMGLSSYSRSRPHVEACEKVFYEALDFRDGAFVQDRPLRDSYFDLRDRLEGHRFDNVAAALQNWATALTRAWIAHWLHKTGKSVLCFSGGLSMNIKTNGDLLDLPGLRHLSVPASGGDESTPIGACYLAAVQAGEEVEPLRHVYLGGEVDGDPEADWRHGIARAGLPEDQFAVENGVGTAELARLLAANAIVARCVGPMEFGARALGNRSILAHPSDVENLKRINDAIKNRDFWMPFTPSILAEEAEGYLVVPKGIRSPFMTIGYQSTERARKEIIAALHPADYSARPQFVDRNTNPDYWRLIAEFSRLTGVSALLNTSLNLHGDPMNRSVSDAARTLALSELDFLALPGDRLLYKRRARAVLDRALGAE